MKVDYNGAYNCSSNMSSIRSNIEKEVLEIKQLIDILISSGDWNSMASEKYLSEVSSSFGNIEQFLTMLTSYINRMNESINSYKSFEEQIVFDISFGKSAEQAFSENFGGM